MFYIYDNVYIELWRIGISYVSRASNSDGEIGSRSGTSGSVWVSDEKSTQHERTGEQLAVSFDLHTGLYRIILCFLQHCSHLVWHNKEFTYAEQWPTKAFNLLLYHINLKQPYVMRPVNRNAVYTLCCRKLTKIWDI